MAATSPALPAVSMLPLDLRFQVGPLGIGVCSPTNAPSFGRQFRVARDNGWVCCGGWHGTPEEAVRCVGRRLRKAAAA